MGTSIALSIKIFVNLATEDEALSVSKVPTTWALIKIPKELQRILQI